MNSATLKHRLQTALKGHPAPGDNHRAIYLDALHVLEVQQKRLEALEDFLEYADGYVKDPDPVAKALLRPLHRRVLRTQNTLRRMEKTREGGCAGC